MNSLNQIRSLMDVNTAVAVRMAFAARRAHLLAGWMEVQGHPVLMQWWADSITVANDAQIALGLEAL